MEQTPYLSKKIKIADRIRTRRALPVHTALGPNWLTGKWTCCAGVNTLAYSPSSNRGISALEEEKEAVVVGRVMKLW